MTPYEIARSKLGLKEIPGKVHNPEIVAMFAKVGHEWVKDDETAWCAAFMGWSLEMAGYPSTRKLDARSYLGYGEGVLLDDAQPGDIVIFWRGTKDGWQGHVGYFVRRADDRIMVLGGNQSDAISIAPYPVSRLLAVRRIVKPAGIRPEVAISGALAGATAATGEWLGLPPAATVAGAVALAVALFFIIRKARA